MRLLLHNKIKGFGLIEILISLVIFAVGVISVTTLNVKTYRIIKNNELADFADRTMVKSLEYFKTPTIDVQTNLENWMNSSPTKNVEVSIDPSSLIDDSLPLLFRVLGYPSVMTLQDSCDPAGLYKITTSPTSIYNGFVICEQVFIEKKTNGYKITSKVIYDIGVSEPKINQLIGYRPFTYEGN